MFNKERIAAKIFRNLTWYIKGEEKHLYLTFDDGPSLEITPWVLSVLKKNNIKATFFCIGKNVKKHPLIYNQIIEQGHTVGNHTFSHLKGWDVSTKLYIDNIKKASETIHSKLFRPPYGRIKFRQIKKLKNQYKIIMWDVLTKDYNTILSKEKCLQNIKNKTSKGSIIVFHDTLKAEKNLKYVLPKIIKHFTNKGYQFKPIAIS